MPRFTLSKDDKILSHKEAALLFTEGKALKQYPLRLIWKQSPRNEGLPIRILFSVSKRNFSRAVDRNRIKRLLRESYRLMKPGLFLKIPEDTKLEIAVIFTGNDLPPFTSIQKDLAKALDRLIAQLSATP
jgi:ribonuclease P protein component